MVVAIKLMAKVGDPPQVQMSIVKSSPPSRNLEYI